MVEPGATESTTPRRKSISPRRRYEILRRDDHTCRYCGGRAPDVALTVDHVIPVALGGTDDPTNLVAACKDCNTGKASTAPDAPTVAQVAEEQFRWAREMEAVARAAAEQAQAEHEYIAALDDAWAQWGYGPNRTPVPRPKDWENSARHWKAAGLPIELLLDAVRIAMNADHVTPDNTWRYFCGVAWTKVRALQDEARGRL